MRKTALVPVADGSEEMEAVTIIDVLRRAGATVTVASVNSLQITASRGVKLTADCLIGACAEQVYDVIALPGGMPGAEHLRDDPVLKRLLIRQFSEERLCAAICAAPAVVFHSHGLVKNRRVTCHASLADQMDKCSWTDEPVVIDGHCITSQGPGTALAFALCLVELLYDGEKRLEVAGPMVTQ